MPPLRIMIRQDCFEYIWADEAAYAVLDTIDSEQPYLTHDMVGCLVIHISSVGGQKHMQAPQRGRQLKILTDAPGSLAVCIDLRRQHGCADKQLVPFACLCGSSYKTVFALTENLAPPGPGRVTAAASPGARHVAVAVAASDGRRRDREWGAAAHVDAAAHGARCHV